jgi:hypothetical protein
VACRRARTQGIVEPIAITMNPGTRGLCGADEKTQGKKKKKKGGLRGPTDEPPNNPNYNYVKCRFDPNVRLPHVTTHAHTTIACAIEG